MSALGDGPPAPVRIKLDQAAGLLELSAVMHWVIAAGSLFFGVGSGINILIQTEQGPLDGDWWGWGVVALLIVDGAIASVTGWLGNKAAEHMRAGRGRAALHTALIAAVLIPLIHLPLCLISCFHMAAWGTALITGSIAAVSGWRTLTSDAYLDWAVPEDDT